MRSFKITKSDAGTRLDRFVKKTCETLPANLMYKYIRLKRIKVNGKGRPSSSRLNEGDVVDMYVGDEFFEKSYDKYDFLKAGKELNIIYEDENILILDKKAGLLSHPDDTEYRDALTTRVARYLYEKGEYDPESSFAPSLANRIDRNTGGLVLAAKNEESLKILNEKIKNREIDKSYLLVTVGKPPKNRDIMTAFMKKDEKKNIVTVKSHPFEGAKTMITEYAVLNSKGGLSLIEAKLHTGRTHQIRAHFAFIGCPLLGDGKYGKNEINKKYGGGRKQFLYSYKIAFNFKNNAGRLSYLNGKTFETHDIWFLKPSSPAYFLIN